MPQYEITINDRDYPVSSQDIDSLDLVSTGPDTYHLLKDGQSYHLEVLDRNLVAKTLHLRINGKDFHLSVSDETDLLVKKLGFATVEVKSSKDVMAPMPGLVLDIMVAPGDIVGEGTPLLILEAMKMENVLKAEGEGEVKSISVAKGDAVEKRQLLIEID